MSELAGGGGADRGGGDRKTRDDPWMNTVTNVSGFLAGFSLATVVVIADAPEQFPVAGRGSAGADDRGGGAGRGCSAVEERCLFLRGVPAALA